MIDESSAKVAGGGTRPTKSPGTASLTRDVTRSPRQPRATGFSDLLTGSKNFACAWSQGRSSRDQSGDNPPSLAAML
ncbi:unnamed protein product [Peniophora sp. CBMAI 1063]|nr:unnamed protein product [Peniophora sp. CBMAI 1063]